MLGCRAWAGERATSDERGGVHVDRPPVGPRLDVCQLWQGLRVGEPPPSGGILSNEELTVHTRHHSFSHGKQRYTEASARPGLSQREARAQSHTLVVDESGRLVRSSGRWNQWQPVT